jgi:hypothetical protein
MKPPPDNPEFAKFTAAMRHIMGVSKVTLKEREAEEKKETKGQQKRGPKPKTTVQ